MAKMMRGTALRFAAQFISRSCGSTHAGEGLGVIFRAPIRFATAKGVAEEGSPSMHSNNPLAVKLESENDAACEKFTSNPFVTHFDLKRRLSAATTARISSNDQHVEA